MQYEKAEHDISSEETLRLEKLRDYEILNTPAESAFDQITQLAAEIFQVPYAGICFQGDGDFFVKSEIGGAASEIVQNLNSDRFVFFASMPLVSPDGYHIGVVYVADTTFKLASEQQLRMLQHLAYMVMEKLAFRMAIRRTLRAYDDRLHVLVHDLKNPMTTISLQSELLGSIPGINDKAAIIAGKINAQSKKMIDKLNGILSAARKEATSFKPDKDKVDLKQLLEQVKKGFELSLEGKNQTVLINIPETIEIFADPGKIAVIFSQLIDNAIKFSPMGSEIILTHRVADDEVTILVKDNGVGLTEEDLSKVFMKFAQLSSFSTNRENSYGLGLITANALVDIHKGKLWAESAGKDLGTTFYVTLPKK
ncbi:sensor histidine kinase [Pedobacter zeae]|uniref:histidine kinase n=1 Tax=Pedobacter zeae TaxID=1737356 RepID=A0A7W6K8G0_9SPHI|nr:HAMP domain-containing sensor histidine kinase [Pedobacter zeae]MBB4107128.1 signal transduction histidine kinase [Pedobacter zeae]GGH05906.1 sensor histidine kinase [Pedobacter zeae]